MLFCIYFLKRYEYAEYAEYAKNVTHTWLIIASIHGWFKLLDEKQGENFCVPILEDGAAEPTLVTKMEGASVGPKAEVIALRVRLHTHTHTNTHAHVVPFELHQVDSSPLLTCCLVT